MATDPHSELFQFHQFVGEQLGSGRDLTPEETLDLWRAEHPGDDDTIAAVQEALDDLAAGDRGRPYEEVLAELRRRYGNVS
jgi:hypothetical protein